MEHLIKKFESELAMLLVEQLVARFNREVGNHGCVSSQPFFLRR